MNKVGKQKLHAELRAAGASKAELAELASIAGKLGNLKAGNTPAVQKRSKKLRPALTVSTSAAFGLALGAFLVIASQTVLPGNALYPVQAVSDNLASAIDSSYKSTVMMKRADQVKLLINAGAPSSRVLAALADYQKQAASYKSENSNYAAFEYCKDSLEQAAAHATASERQTINKTLSSLANV